MFKLATNYVETAENDQSQGRTYIDEKRTIVYLKKF